MNYLQKPWIRVIISLLLGGILTEIFTMHTSDRNHINTPDKSSLYTLVSGFIIYILLTVVVNKSGRK